MRAGEPCDICGKGLERPAGAIGTLRCRGCHEDQLTAVIALCIEAGWHCERVTYRGRDVVRVDSPVGRVHLVDIADAEFLMVDVGRVFDRAA